MHIAAAMKTPIVALFGPSKSDQTGPYATIARIVSKPFACREACDETSCTHHIHQACMKAITPGDLLKGVIDIAPVKISVDRLQVYR